MNRNILLLALSVFVGAFAGCNASNHEHTHDDHQSHEHDAHDHAHHHSHDHAVDHRHSGDTSVDDDHEINIITIEPEQAQLLGVVAREIIPGEFNSVIRGFGEVVSSPSGTTSLVATASGVLRYSKGINLGAEVGSGRVIATIESTEIAGGDETARLKAAYDAAKRELDRLTPLYADGIVSAREYDRAVAELQMARAACSGRDAGGIVKTVSAGIITRLDIPDGAYVSTGQEIGTISTPGESTIVASIPANRVAQYTAGSEFNFRSSADGFVYNSSELGVKPGSGQQPVGIVNGYAKVYFPINTLKVLPGMTGEVFIMGEPRSSVISVPVDAVDEDQGVNFVYVKIDDDCYRKTPVELGATDGSRVEILHGLEPGSSIVVEGRTFVRMAQNAGAVPEGHSHSH